MNLSCKHEHKHDSVIADNSLQVDKSSMLRCLVQKAELPNPIADSCAKVKHVETISTVKHLWYAEHVLSKGTWQEWLPFLGTRVRHCRTQCVWRWVGRRTWETGRLCACFIFPNNTFQHVINTQQKKQTKTPPQYFGMLLVQIPQHFPSSLSSICGYACKLCASSVSFIPLSLSGSWLFCFFLLKGQTKHT